MLRHLIFLFISVSCYSITPLLNLADFSPSIIIDMKYHSIDNFLGQKVNGYNKNKCLLTEKTLRALNSVQDELKKMSLSLKVFDCYRPQKAVDHFITWSKDLSDQRTKNKYYPKIEKENLFSQGYIAKKSGHSRGSTVDVTIDGLDMGTEFDFFSEKSHTFYKYLPAQAKANRLLLNNLMQKYGMRNYPKEWWHFTLINEPFKDKFFNFDIE
ncbi:MAG: M15 family metallopeptidase [Halobacteriovoraceae bacterium]|nr:M15 family metallopeptidase [Halobacteriovoraceae bacterium]